MDYEFQDFADMFKVALGAIIQRQGVQMASEGHAKAMTDNAAQVAVTAATRLAQERARHRPTLSGTAPVLPPAKRGQTT